MPDNFGKPADKEVTKEAKIEQINKEIARLVEEREKLIKS